MEIWKSITKDYLVSSKWRIKSLKRRKEIIMSLYDSWRWYMRIRINKKMQSVHRLVAQAFIPNPLNLPQVNHINWIRNDNNVENLEWSNNSLNQKHSYEKLWRKHPRTWLFWKNNPLSKKVWQYTLEWKGIKIWDSQADIIREFWWLKWSLNNAINWRAKTYKWYIWKLIDF